MLKLVSSARYTVFLSESTNLFPFIAEMLVLNVQLPFSHFYTHTHQALINAERGKRGKQHKVKLSRLIILTLQCKL